MAHVLWGKELGHFAQTQNSRLGTEQMVCEGAAAVLEAEDVDDFQDVTLGGVLSGMIGKFH